MLLLFLLAFKILKLRDVVLICSVFGKLIIKHVIITFITRKTFIFKTEEFICFVGFGRAVAGAGPGSAVVKQNPGPAVVKKSPARP